jgi:hypothetical protein
LYFYYSLYSFLFPSYPTIKIQTITMELALLKSHLPRQWIQQRRQILVKRNIYLGFHIGWYF